MLYIDDETRSNISRYVVNTGDLIVSVVGTIGLTAYIGKTLDEANLTENCNKLTSFKGDFAAWSYFFLRSSMGMEAIRLGTVGAVQTGSVEKVGVAPDPKRVGPASWNLEHG